MGGFHKKNGDIHLAGSAYLNLLVYPDLDVYFDAPNTPHTLEVFAKATRNLMCMDSVTSIEFEKSLHKRYPGQAPEGLFLQYRIFVQDRLWKVDIWAMKEKAVLEAKMREAVDFKQRMTSEQRELILRAKHELMVPFGRTPVGNSYLIYKAVLYEALDTVDKIIAYVKDQGGNVDKLK